MPPTGLITLQEFLTIVVLLLIMLSLLSDGIIKEIGELKIHGELDGENKDILL